MTRTLQIRAEWEGEHRFATGRPDGPVAMLDGSAVVGQSPMDAVLSALAACSGVDVVDILGKRRTPPERLTIEVVGTRREEMPRRYTAIELRFMIDGAGIDADQAQRAIALAFEKYCSVAATLAPDTAVRTVLVLNGEER